MTDLITETNTKSHEILCGYKDLLSVENLSSIFEVSKNTIYKELKAGKFGEPIQVGRSIQNTQSLYPAKVFSEQIVGVWSSPVL